MSQVPGGCTICRSLPSPGKAVSLADPGVWPCPGPGPLSGDAGCPEGPRAGVRMGGIREDCLEEGVLALDLRDGSDVARREETGIRGRGEWQAGSRQGVLGGALSVWTILGVGDREQ